jgi:hypothetical protein
MRRKRIDPKARGRVCAVKRANVIGARDQRTTSGPAGRQDPHRQAEDTTAPAIIALQQNNAPSRHDKALYIDDLFLAARQALRHGLGARACTELSK